VDTICQHFCDDPQNFPLDKFFQKGVGVGQKVLFIGESPAPNGWRKSGKACYTPDGKLLPTGKRLNELFNTFKLTVDKCGFTELAKCYVGKNKKLLKDCSRKCWPILLKQMENNKSRLLIILGVHTTNIFSKLVKKELPIGKLTKIRVNGKTYTVLPIFHPSPINPYGHEKNKKIFAKLQNDINKNISS